MNELMTFNAFGEGRLKSKSTILTITTVKSLDNLVYNEVEIADLDQELDIDEDDPVRFVFAVDMQNSRDHKIFKRQVAGPTIAPEDQQEFDKVLANLVGTLYDKVMREANLS